MANYRINGFRQIERFYSTIFSGKHDVKTSHISLYMFFLNQCNRMNWPEWFKCNYDLAMNGACIGSKKSYYSTLNDLKDWGLINYIPGENNWKSPKISIIELRQKNEPQNEPQCEPLHTPLIEQANIPLTIPLHTPLPIHIIKLLTINLDNLVTKYSFLREIDISKMDAEELYLKFGGKKKESKKFTPPTMEDFKNYFKENGYTVESSITAFKGYEVADWHDSEGKPVKNWKQKCQHVWFKPNNKELELNGQTKITAPGSWSMKTQ